MVLAKRSPTVKSVKVLVLTLWAIEQEQYVCRVHDIRVPSWVYLEESSFRIMNPCKHEESYRISNNRYSFFVGL